MSRKNTYLKSGSNFTWLILLSLMLVYFVYSNIMLENHIKQTKLKMHIETISEIITTGKKETDDNYFQYYSSRQYSIFSPQEFRKQCLINISSDTLSKLEDIKYIDMIATYNNKEIKNELNKQNPLNITITKLLSSDLEKINCPNFIWNSNLKELIYKGKPVRFLIKYIN